MVHSPHPRKKSPSFSKNLEENVIPIRPKTAIPTVASSKIPSNSENSLRFRMMRKFKTNQLELFDNDSGDDSNVSRIDFTQPFIPPKGTAQISNITETTATASTRATFTSTVTTRDKLSPIDDASAFLGFAARALARDEFTQCFEPKPIRSPKEYLPYLTYLLGLLIRYFVIFPLRLSFFLLANWVFISLFPLLFITRSQRFMMFLYGWFCRAWLVAFGARITYHGRKPCLTRTPHIFVSNHTSFIDFFLLSAIGKCHATVAQVHGGLFGFLQRHILSLNGSLTFQRSEIKDRLMVAQKMKEHVHRMVENVCQAPLLIFPEGTCVNNEATVLFHKGAFELGAIVCPVAIKYRKELSDPYWNTREQTFSQHLLYLMTRWHLDADVYWLDPTKVLPDEDGIHFANRIKEEISLKCNIKNLSWNGYMKNYMNISDQQRLLKGSQEAYGFTVKERLSSPPPSKCAHNLPQKSDDIVEQTPFLPQYLSEGAITNIKNELIKRTTDNIKEINIPQENLKDNINTNDDLLTKIRSKNEDILLTWRKAAHHSQDGRRVIHCGDDNYHPETILFNRSCESLPSFNSPLNIDNNSSITENSNRRMENNAWRHWYKGYKKLKNK